MDPFPTTYQRRRTARKPRIDAYSQLSPSSPAGYNVDKHYLRIITNLHFLVAEERKFLNTSSPFSSIPRAPRSKSKVVLNRSVMTSRTAEGISEEYPCPASLTAPPQSSLKSRKRKTKTKNEQSDYSDEVTIPRRVHLRGRAGRGRNNCNTITKERGKLDSATFFHYFMHIWRAFPEEKMNSVAYFDPLWFELYTNKHYGPKVVDWIKAKSVFSKKYVFVPIVMWSHWSLLIFCHMCESPDSKTNTPCMLLLDSLHAIGPTRLESIARRLLFDMHVSEERLESKEQLKKMRFLIPNVPQQKNGDECGFYVLYYIKLFLESAPENFDISEGYPYFLKKEWFSEEEVESFCKNLDTLPVDINDLDDDSASVDSGGSVELIENLFVDGK
ncbi:hypothetical protein ACP275_04G070600 [Erythranthe tilingii]